MNIEDIYSALVEMQMLCCNVTHYLIKVQMSCANKARPIWNNECAVLQQAPQMRRCALRPSLRVGVCVFLLLGSVSDRHSSGTPFCFNETTGAWLALAGVDSRDLSIQLASALRTPDYHCQRQVHLFVCCWFLRLFLLSFYFCDCLVLVQRWFPRSHHGASERAKAKQSSGTNYG